MTLLGCHLTLIGLKAEETWPCQGFIGLLAASRVVANFTSFYAQNLSSSVSGYSLGVSKRVVWLISYQYLASVLYILSKDRQSFVIG